MKKEKGIEKTARAITNVLDTMLIMEANSTACVIFHQPKAPETISRFRFEKR